MDINSVFEAGQAYVMLSRVQCIDQLFIVDDLKPEKIRASPAALDELKRLREISFNRNPSTWHKRDTNYTFHSFSVNTKTIVGFSSQFCITYCHLDASIAIMTEKIHIIHLYW